MKTDFPASPALLVDDESVALESAQLALLSGGIDNIVKCDDSRSVIGLLADGDVSTLILDLHMPHVSGEELLSKITLDFPEIPVIVVTGADDADTAVRCMKSGAFDYLVKPVEKNRMVMCVRHAIEMRALRSENSSLREHMMTDSLNHPEVFSGIVTGNGQMRALFQYLETVAKTPQPVLITGETGVGKELAARAVHELSGRTGAFVAVNVAGLARIAHRIS